MMALMLEIIRQKRFAVTLLSALLLLGTLLAFVERSMVTPKLQSAHERWSQMRSRSSAAGRTDAAATYRQGRSDLASLHERIPSKRQFPRVLGDILDAAASSGVTIGNVTYVPQAVKDQKLFSYAVSLSVNGSYAGIKSLLAEVQGMRDLVIVDGMGLSNQDMFSERVVMDLKLTAYLKEAP